MQPRFSHIGINVTAYGGLDPVTSTGKPRKRPMNMPRGQSDGNSLPFRFVKLTAKL